MNREELVNNNLMLVHSCCKRFKGRGVEYDDLYGAGCLGLVKAANAFKEELGFCFSTYAVPVILGEIKRLFRDGGAIKVSRSLKELSLRTTKVRDELRVKWGREPTVKELALALNVSVEETAEALSAAVPPSSLSYLNEDGEIKELDVGVSKSAEDEVSNRLAINQILSRFEKNDQNLIKLRYFAGKTQSETARLLGMTQVQISRREKKLLKIMSELL
ncbi:MAG: sigma-70 family RNA polymerase sigma factor [Clostridia bacterium]|nr:sigma-70 family RNA polymerase sigma factor [Clostridia bacterium]MBQ4130717.1 sigma-70 family RNA polymerase sigma factor [Clostridia bacterium]MBQ7107540.1 sigma-70 family RNA polymerase sigma factor [Clostridia bacterium]MBQ9919465.1 sigma-70 family RNA polymerase sigma factor [Clostridia bacterium]